MTAQKLFPYNIKSLVSYKNMGLGLNGKPISSHKGSWAESEAINNDKAAAESVMSTKDMIAARKIRLKALINHAKNCPAIFENANISWYMHVFWCDAETARTELGYAKPIAVFPHNIKKQKNWYHIRI